MAAPFLRLPNACGRAIRGYDVGQGRRTVKWIQQWSPLIGAAWLVTVVAGYFAANSGYYLEKMAAYARFFGGAGS